jgi:hypothetical protein
MLASPASQIGRRASRKMSQTSTRVASVLLAPRRWHIEDVAVQKLPAIASGIAISTARRLRSCFYS